VLLKEGKVKFKDLFLFVEAQGTARIGGEKRPEKYQKDERCRFVV